MDKHNPEQDAPEFSNPQQQPPQQQPPPPAEPPQQAYHPPQQHVGPPKKKGFNWLLCCGIGCLVMIIIGGLVAYCGYRAAAPMINMGVEMAALQEEVQRTSLSTIKAEAESVTSTDLLNSTGQYKGKWLVVEGEVAYSATQAPTGNQPGAATYTLGDGMTITHMGQQQPTAQAGDNIRAWGMAVVFDMKALESMPLLGEVFKEEFNDPAYQGPTTLVMFFAKDVELVTDTGEEQGTTTEDPPTE